MDKHCQLMRSTSCVCYSVSSLEHTEYEFVESSANRSFMDAVDALAVLRPKRSWPILTADLTSHCTSSDNTTPKSSGLPTNAPTEVRKSLLVIRIDADTTIPITDAGIQDCSDGTCSSKDALPVNNILVENNPAIDSTVQDTCLEMDIVAVDDPSPEIMSISTVSNDNHLLEAPSSDSARELKETIAWNVSCVSADAASIKCSSRLSRLYENAKISDCCDSVKPSSSSIYSSKLLTYKDAKMSNCADSFKPRSSSHYDAISDCEIMNVHCKKFDKRRKKDRPQRGKRMWKKAPNEMQLNLRTSLFPRTSGIIINISSTDDAEESEIQQELELFQNSLENCEQKASIDAEINETCAAATSNVQEMSADYEDKENVEARQLCEQLDADMNQNCVDFKSSIVVPAPIQKNSSRRDTDKILPERNSRVKRKLDLDVLQFSDCDNIENVTFYENKIPLRNCSALESFSGLAVKKLRAKKKWKEMKAHIQIKTKYCRSLSNSVHGVTFYIHHRVMKLMSMKLEPRTYVSTLSLNQIDAAKGFVKEIVGTACLAPRSKPRQSPENHATSRFAIDAFNADGDLAAEVVNIMINLQHRDLLPEDYDLLLRLDDRVKPKTVDVAILTQLKTESVVCDGDVLDVCAVCLDPYEVGQMKKYLPCQHYFHETCIDNWLSNSSMNCPLDGTPILPS